MNVHTLKTWPAMFQAVWDGRKTAEFRKDDRGFTEGDLLLLREYDPDSDTYSSRDIIAEVTHIAKGFGMPDGYVMLSITTHSRADGRKAA